MKAFEAWWESETDGGSVGERVYAEAAWKFATERAAKIAEVIEEAAYEAMEGADHDEFVAADVQMGTARQIAAAIRSEE